MVNARTQAQEDGIRRVHEYISKQGSPVSTNQVAAEIGYHYKTVYRYIKILCDRKLVKSGGFDDKTVLWTSTRPTLVPWLPSPNGPGPITGFITSITRMPADFKSPLNQNEERFNYYLVMLVRQAMNWSDDDRELIEKYFRTYRAQLELRLQMVNEIIREERFWNKELCQEMVKDPLFNGAIIDRAFSIVNAMAETIRRAEYKEGLQKDILSDG